jgi:putative two-component system response regulator
MPDKILVVDDDDAILEFAKHVLKDLDSQVVTINDPVVALEYLEREKVAVLVSDNNMPVMSGLELIEKANIVSSETVKIIMSAYADLSVALCAINQCQVFKFIPKPWEPKEMFDTVTDALRRYHTLQIIRRENEDVLRSLAQTIELKDPCTKGHCDRVAAFAVQVAKFLCLSMDMQREIKYGSWLHDCGKIGVPEQVLNANRKLEADEYELIKNHPSWGADVARKANLSAVIINVILCHHERFDGTGYPNGLRGEDIPIEARIVSVADIFDALSSDRPYRKGMSLDKALEIVVSMKGKELDPVLVDLFLDRQAFIVKDDNQHYGDELLNKDHHEANKLTLKGDVSIAGVNEQLPLLAQHLVEMANLAPGELNKDLPYEIDLSGVETLDACGCQLLATLFCNLRQRGLEVFSFKLSDDHRDKIHLLGFDDEIFTGECA